MLRNLFILAQDDGGNENLFKILFFVIAGAIWLVNAIINTVKKRQEEQQRDRMRRQLEMEGGARAAPTPAYQPPQPHPARRSPLPPLRPSPLRPSPVRAAPVRAAPVRAAPVRQAPPMRAPAPPRPVQRPAPPKQKRSSRRVSAPPPVPRHAELLESAQILESSITPATAASPSRAQPVAASASAVARWLTPRTLQQQFIITEILQPPLAMRDRHLER